MFLRHWQALYEEVAAFQQACGTAHMSDFWEPGLAHSGNVARANKSVVAMMAARISSNIPLARTYERDSPGRVP